MALLLVHPAHWMIAAVDYLVCPVCCKHTVEFSPWTWLLSIQVKCCSVLSSHLKLFAFLCTLMPTSWPHFGSRVSILVYRSQVCAMWNSPSTYHRYLKQNFFIHHCDLFALQLFIILLLWSFSWIIPLLWLHFFCFPIHSNTKSSH